MIYYAIGTKLAMPSSTLLGNKLLTYYKNYGDNDGKCNVMKMWSENS